MKKILFAVTIFVLSTALAYAQDTALTLDEAVAIALRDNRDVLLSSEAIVKAKWNVKGAYSSLFPQIDMFAAKTSTRELYAKDYDTNQLHIGLTQTLFAGGRIVNTIKQSQYAQKVQEALLDKTKLEIILNVKQAFYTLLLARENAALNKEILNNTKKHIDFIQARFQNGQASDIDVLIMKDSLASVEQAYAASLNQIESGNVLLRQLLFLSEDVNIAPVGEFNYFTPKNIGFDEALLKALKERPEIRQYEAQVEVNKRAVEIAKADSRPTVYASWDYYNSSHMQSPTGFSKNRNDHNILGINISWPIFDGWATKAKVEQAISDLKQARILKDKTDKDIASELKNAYILLSNAVANIKAAETAEIFYRNNFSSIEDKCKKGIASYLDLEDANLSHNVSLFNKKSAVYDYVTAQSDFDKAIGGL